MITEEYVRTVCLKCNAGKGTDAELYCGACVAEYGERARLDRRERIATAVLAGLVHRDYRRDIAAMGIDVGALEPPLEVGLARVSLEYADALIAALDK